MLFSISAFMIFIGFYVIAKVCFFVGVYVITKSIEKRALREKRKRLESYRLNEIEVLLQQRNRCQENAKKDKELFGIRRNRFVS